MSKFQRFSLGLAALGALVMGLLGQVAVFGDVPLVSLRSADGLDSTVVVALMAFSGWAGLSTLIGQFLIPSGFHPPVPPTKVPNPETFDETVKVDGLLSTQAVVEPFEAFREDVHYVRPNGDAHEFYLVASAFAAEQGINFPEKLLWWGTTRPDQVPRRGRPNHYFAFETTDSDDYLVYEVRHNGRAGSGASYNRPRELRVPKSAF